MNLKAKLKQMKSHLQETDEKESISMQQVNPKEQDTTEMQQTFMHMGFHPFYFEDEMAYRKKTVYPFSKTQGNLFEQLLVLTSYWESSTIPHPLSSSGRTPESLLFFDTETTGLSHGAGNRIFLIGYARVRRDGIEVTQHLLKDPGNETAFLTGFLDELNKEDYLVSYNGKSFDWPQVKSRHTFLQTMLPALPKTGHIDLLHAARRFWKDELPSCKLAVVEEEKLGLTRHDDVPGRMAPILYQDYLFDQKPDILRGIIQHNDQDVRSLVLLYLEITRRYLAMENDMTSEERFGAAKWADQLQQYDLAQRHYTELKMSGKATEETDYFYGKLMKKLKHFDQAERCFVYAVSGSGKVSTQAALELAKLYEHQLKDPCKALETVRQYEGHPAFDNNDAQRRLERLQKKCCEFH